MSDDVCYREPDGMTVLRARHRRLAKLVRADGVVEGYDLTRHFDLFHVTVPDLSALARLLRRLSKAADCAVVRGAIVDPARSRGVRRLLHPDPATGESATIAEVRRAWVALDMDGLPLPDGCVWQDLERRAEVARLVLPVTFRDAALAMVATASHGLKAGARLRVWALLNTPLSGREVTRWLRDAPCDPAVFRPAQLIYTAAPIFEGLEDPLCNRLVILPGRERVACPSPLNLTPPPRPPFIASKPQPGAPSSGRYAAAALARATMAVATAPENSRHRTAVRESWGLAKLVAAGLLTDAVVSQAMDGALRQAGKAEGEGSSIAAWAVAQRVGSDGAAR